MANRQGTDSPRVEARRLRREKISTAETLVMEVAQTLSEASAALMLLAREVPDEVIDILGYKGPRS